MFKDLCTQITAIPVYYLEYPRDRLSIDLLDIFKDALCCKYFIRNSKPNESSIVFYFIFSTNLFHLSFEPLPMLFQTSTFNKHQHEDNWSITLIEESGQGDHHSRCANLHSLRLKWALITAQLLIDEHKYLLSEAHGDHSATRLFIKFITYLSVKFICMF